MRDELKAAVDSGGLAKGSGVVNSSGSDRPKDEKEGVVNKEEVAEEKTQERVKTPEK